jgi:hypothetical protein
VLNGIGTLDDTKVEVVVFPMALHIDTVRSKLTNNVQVGDIVFHFILLIFETFHV